MSSELFAGLPGINIPRSKWKNGSNITTTFKHGLLVPVDFIPILPGDGMSYSLRDITRMQTPIAPIYGNIKQSFAAFFVPLRLIWKHTEEFFGANKTTSGYQQTVYKLPHAKYNYCNIGSPSHYLGKPYKATVDTDADGKAYYVANVLKERCYYLIWSEYFRASQITNPVILNVNDATDASNVGGCIGTFNGSNIDPIDASAMMKVAKEFDYFTASTISPQYGAAVTLPLGLTAPLKADSSLHSAGGNIKFNYGSGTFTGTRNMVNDAGVLSTDNSYTPVGTIQPMDYTNLVADLSSATAAKINDIRYAFAVQKYLERANFAGNYFFSILEVHYGVTSPDSRLQRPEFLGRFDEDILIHQVTATADALKSDNTVASSVGNTGAVSVTASGDVHLFDKAFVEPGYVCILRWCRQRQVYSQGVMREDFKKDRFEIYTPELCNLGDQATLTRELYWKAGESDIFGYQEHWGEYRYRPDRVSGLFDPSSSSNLKFWTLAKEFTSKPQLNDTFIFEEREMVDRALTTGSAVDEYMSDTWSNIIWTREMPVRTMPGLIDHFGAF